MNVIGAMRVKNEARWIRRCIESILPVCQRVVVFDDWSIDETRDICRTIPGVELITSPFVGIDEARDKNFLLNWIRQEADWVMMIDGDEMLMPGWSAGLCAAMRICQSSCISLPILYAWDREDQVRVDGVYGNFRRQSIFRPGSAQFHARGGPNFHCGNVPAELRQSTAYSEAALLHFGYLHREDRLRKYAWYNEQDPRNDAEDRYRHMVIGDAFPADSRFRHAGPLDLRDIRWTMEQGLNQDGARIHWRSTC